MFTCETGLIGLKLEIEAKKLSDWLVGVAEVLPIVTALFWSVYCAHCECNRIELGAWSNAELTLRARITFCILSSTHPHGY